IPRSPASRATWRLWLAGGLAVGALGTIRALPVERNWLYLLLLALAATIAALLIGRRTPPGVVPPGAYGMVAVGVAGGLAVLAPWLFLGALGRAGETGLALAAAGAHGMLVDILLGLLWHAFT